jgi:hypothetical protein
MSGYVITGEHIEAFRLLSLEKMLKIEVSTGLKSRVSPVPAVKSFLWSHGVKPKHSKIELLKQYSAVLYELRIRKTLD